MFLLNSIYLKKRAFRRKMKKKKVEKVSAVNKGQMTSNIFNMF